VKTATKLEQTMFRQNKDKKSASWLLKSAEEMGLELDDDMKAEVEGKMGRPLDRKE